MIDDIENQLLTITNQQTRLILHPKQPAVSTTIQSHHF